MLEPSVFRWQRHCPIARPKCKALPAITSTPACISQLRLSSDSLPMLSRTYVFDPRPRLSFRVVAKQYWNENSQGADAHITSTTGEDNFTLISIHGNGAHKEHWEPTIQRMFESQHSSASSSVSIRFHDMWALDLLNHGDAAVVNEEVLRWGYDVFSWEDHARGVHAFLAGLGTGVEVDFSKRRLVLVGHSMGAVVAMLATTYHPLLDISSLHLIEPALLGNHPKNFMQSLIRKALAQRDIWSSTEEVVHALKSQPKWKTWDDRILKVFIKHGFRPLPTEEYPTQREGLTLKSTKKQQAANASDNRSSSVGFRLLPYLLKEIPTHITYGAITDFVPCMWQQEVLHVLSGGISNFTSVTSVPEAGHMILQSHPDIIADIILRALAQFQLPLSKGVIRPKL